MLPHPHFSGSLDRSTGAEWARAACLAALTLAAGHAQVSAQVITEFPVPTAGSQPHGIAAGRDGAHWFTELVGGRIGRITTDGAITEFTIPTANSSPFGITAGPDGNTWFTEGGAGQIGRITPSRAITEFSIPFVV